MIKTQDGRDPGAAPAPRQVANSTIASVENIAHFMCSEIAWRAAALTSKSSTAPNPVANAISAASAPRHRFHVPTMATVEAAVSVRSSRAARSRGVAIKMSARGKCTTRGCHPGMGLTCGSPGKGDCATKQWCR
jgi:hypothetical protein